MKIQDLIATPIAISDPPLRNASGLHAPYALRIIVELKTDNGISGVSEVPGDTETEKILNFISDGLVGQDPHQLNSLFLNVQSRFSGTLDFDGSKQLDYRYFPRVWSAVEVACLDIIGKDTGRPICDLLGGRLRDRVPFAAYLFYKEEGAGGEYGFGIDPGASGWDAARQTAALDPQGIVAEAAAMRDKFGFRSLKLKGGVFPPHEEAAAIIAMRDAFGPEVPLRLDPNAVWSMEASLSVAQELEGILEYLEDPIRGQENMARLRKKIGIPLATNMCTTSFADLPASIAVGSEDIILSDHHFWGGLRACADLFRICEVFGRGVSMHSNSHVGVSLAAMIHLGSVIPNLQYDLDTHYPWQTEEVIIQGQFSFQDGYVDVPKGPGLGVEIDRVALEKLHTKYLECGLAHRDDQTEMQKIEPGWQFKPVRW